MRSLPQLRQYSPFPLNLAAKTAPSCPLSTFTSFFGRVSTPAALLIFYLRVPESQRLRIIMNYQNGGKEYGSGQRFVNTLDFNRVLRA